MSGVVANLLSGLTTGLTISSGVADSATALATVQDSTVLAGGSLDILPGAVALTDIVEGVLTAAGSLGLSGLVSGALVQSGGSETILGGGIAIGTVLDALGSATVSSGGEVSSTTVNSGALLTVSAGGTALDTVLGSGGVASVLSGAIVSGLTVDAGAVLFDLATISGLVLENGGSIDFGQVPFTSGETATYDSQANTLTLSAGGVTQAIALSASVGPGSVFQVTSGASGTTVVSLLSAVVASSGASVSALTLGTGSLLTVQAGGTAVDDILQGVTGTVLSGGVASATVLDGSVLTVSLGGLDVSATIGSGGVEAVLGSSLSAAVLSGGQQTVSSGGTATGTVISLGGIVSVGTGGTLDGATVGSSGVLDVANGALDSAASILSGGTELLSGGVASATMIAGTQIVSSALAVSATILGGGTQVVGLGGTVDGTSVNSGGLLVLSGGTASGTMLVSGAAIELAVLPYASGGSASIDPTTDILSATIGANTYTQQLAGTYTGDTVQLSLGVGGGTTVTIACYGRGTLIATDSGDKPVESLAIGDWLLTVSGIMRPLRWIGRRSYAKRFVDRNAALRPVCIRAGALGQGLPERDLVVSPQHALYFDGVLVPARLLLNGASIVQMEADNVEYFHLELDSHDVILANGVPAESYVDDDNRGIFHNAAEYGALYPDAGGDPAYYCAPRVEHGYTLEAIRRRIAARAAYAA